MVAVNEKTFFEQIDFPIERVPVYGVFNDEPIDTGKDSIIRTDLIEPKSLSVVSSKYALVTHEESFRSFTDAVSVLGKRHLESYDIYNDGSSVHSKWRFPEHQIDIGNGDLVDLQLSVNNSYDLSCALNVIFGGFRLLCSNGMVIGRELTKERFIHLGNIDTGAIKNQLLESAEVAMAEMKRRIQKLQKKKVKDTEELFEKIQKTGKISAKHVDAAKLIYLDPTYEADKERNMWSVLNAFTQYATHNLEGRVSEAVTEAAGKVVYGLAA